MLGGIPSLKIPFVWLELPCLNHLPVLQLVPEDTTRLEWGISRTKQNGMSPLHAQ